MKNTLRMSEFDFQEKKFKTEGCEKILFIFLRVPRSRLPNTIRFAGVLK